MDAEEETPAYNYVFEHFDKEYEVFVQQCIAHGEDYVDYDDWCVEFYYNCEEDAGVSCSEQSEATIGDRKVHFTHRDYTFIAPRHEACPSTAYHSPHSAFGDKHPRTPGQVPPIGIEAIFPTYQRIEAAEEKNRWQAYSLYLELVKEADYDKIDEDKFFLSPSDSFALCKRVRPQLLTFQKEYYQREYTVDSGASFHTVALQDLTKDESKTIRTLEKPIVMGTVNGEVIAYKEADIYVHDLEMLITALVVPTSSPSLISVGKLAEEMDIEFSWGKLGPILTKPDGSKVSCQMKFSVPMIAAAQACPNHVKEASLPGTAIRAAEDSPTTTTTSGGSDGNDEDGSGTEVASAPLQKGTRHKFTRATWQKAPSSGDISDAEPANENADDLQDTSSQTLQSGPTSTARQHQEQPSKKSQDSKVTDPPSPRQIE